MIKIILSLMVAMVATNDGKIIHYPTAAAIIEATTADIMEATTGANIMEATTAADTNATVTELTPTFTPIDAVTATVTTATATVTTATVTTAAFTPPPWEVMMVVGVQTAVMVAAMVAAVAWIKKRLGK